jgi:PAS domain S-box-containing protein
MDRNKSTNSRSYRVKKRYWLPVFTILLGIIVLVILLIGNSMRKQQHQNYLFMDAIEDTQLNTALFHLWLDEYLAGDRTKDLETVFSFVESAETELHIMLEGGKTEHGELSHPPKDPIIIEAVKNLQVDIGKIKKNMTIRIQNSDEIRQGSILEQNTDLDFEAFIDDAKRLETIFIDSAKQYTDRSDRIILLIIVAWIMVLALTIIGMFFLERSRSSTERAILESEEKFRGIAERNYDAILMTDAEGYYTYISPGDERNTGLKAEDSIGKHFTDFLTEETKAKAQEFFNKVLKDETLEGLELQAQHKDGTPFIIECNITPIHKDEKVIGTQIIYRNITERKQTEQLLTTERRRFSDILAGTHVGTWEWNVQTGETIFNGHWANISGYTLEELAPISIDTWKKFVHPDDIKKCDNLLNNHFKNESDFFECETRMRHKNGSWVWVLDRGKVATWTDDGKPLLMSGTHQDITERKLSEERLQASLKEKDVLLSEIHHRVKNNLQVISGLLQIQLRAFKRGTTKSVEDVFEESKNRIKSMAVIHDLLHRTGELSGIDFRESADILGSDLVRTFGMEDRVNFSATGAKVKLGIDQAIPVALIINELIMNSLKHAFPSDKTGKIEVTITEGDSRMVEFLVSDDGIGMDKEINWKNPTTVGLDLANGLVRQLRGVIELDRSAGTRFKISFKRV